MKKTHIYFFSLMLLVLGPLIFMVWSKNHPKAPIVTSRLPAITQNLVAVTPEHSGQVQEHMQRQASTFVNEISREICKQEEAAISEIVWPSIKTLNLKPGDIVPESDVVLSPAQAIDVLRRTANSKCSSFRKEMSERFFAEFGLNQENYSEFFSHRDLPQGNGVDTYRLIKKALEAFDKATEKEAKPLRDMILYSLKTFIKDAHHFVSIGGALSALKDIRNKELVSYPTMQQVEAFQKHFSAVSESRLQEAQRLIGKYFPPGTDFMTMTHEQFISAYGYQGAKEKLEQERTDFAIVKELSQQLNNLVGDNF